MIYVWNHPGWYEGAETEDPGWGRLFDARGVEIDKPVVYADTETGVVIENCKGPNGEFVEALNHDGSHARMSKMKVSRHPAPLTFVSGGPRGPDLDYTPVIVIGGST